MQKKHFFKFVEGLRLHESRKADHFFSLIQGLPATRFQRNFRNQKRESDIKYYTNLLFDKTFSVKQFLHAMADDVNCMYDLRIQKILVFPVRLYVRYAKGISLNLY